MITFGPVHCRLMMSGWGLPLTAAGQVPEMMPAMKFQHVMFDIVRLHDRINFVRVSDGVTQVPDHFCQPVLYLMCPECHKIF